MYRSQTTTIPRRCHRPDHPRTVERTDRVAVRRERRRSLRRRYALSGRQTTRRPAGRATHRLGSSVAGVRPKSLQDLGLEASVATEESSPSPESAVDEHGRHPVKIGAQLLLSHDILTAVGTCDHSRLRVSNPGSAGESAVVPHRLREVSYVEEVASRGHVNPGRVPPVGMNGRIRQGQPVRDVHTMRRVRRGRARRFSGS